MLAGLDLLLMAVLCTAHDVVPERGKNARRGATCAEVVTPAVAQEMMGIDQLPAPSADPYVVSRRSDRGALGCARPGAVSGSTWEARGLSSPEFRIGGES